MKKWLSMFLAAVMLCGVLAGCGGTQSGSTPASGAQSASAAGDSNVNAEGFPIVNEPITLRGMVALNANVKDWNRVLEQDTQAFAWQCETVRNKSTLHPQTDAVVAEIEGGPDTVVNVTVNGRTHTASIAQLLDGGVTWHVKPWHSEAVKIHAAVPDSAYEMVLEAEDEGSGGMDVYHAEFAQKNGQWAFVSPIYAGL